MSDPIAPDPSSAPACPGEAVWILSDGRSGSTWFAQVLNFHGRAHVEHEPIHHAFNPLLAGQPLLPPPDAGETARIYAPLFEQIRAGSYRSHRFPPQTEAADGLFIRDIHGLLIAPDLLELCPWLRPAVIVRHPADVAQSKLALAHWQWFSDLPALLASAELADHLGPLIRHVERAASLFERYVLVWAISHRWFFARCAPDRVPIVRYPSSVGELAALCEQLLPHLAGPNTVQARAFQAAWSRRSMTDRPPLAGNPLRRLFAAPRLSRAQRLYAERMIDTFDLRWLVEPAPALAEAG